jgi:hypothetical protein
MNGEMLCRRTGIEIMIYGYKRNGRMDDEYIIE